MPFASSQPVMDALVDAYGGVVLDIDGVLCRGDRAVPGSAAVLAALRERGLPFCLVTNNAMRTPEQVASWLAGMGLDVTQGEVLTSPAVAARMITPGTRCLVVGSDGLHAALRQRGAEVVTDPSEAEAVVVGLDPRLTYDDLRRATLALRRGARFVATNADLTFPGSDGIWPGNGAILAALTAASGRHPEVAGKPAPPLFHAAADRLGRTPLLMVGDRLDTDIYGAAALGWDTALVLTGVTSADAAAAAGATWVLDDVRGLLAPA